MCITDADQRHKQHEQSHAGWWDFPFFFFLQWSPPQTLTEQNRHFSFSCPVQQKQLTESSFTEGDSDGRLTAVNGASSDYWYSSVCSNQNYTSFTCCRIATSGEIQGAASKAKLEYPYSCSSQSWLYQWLLLQKPLAFHQATRGLTVLVLFTLWLRCHFWLRCQAEAGGAAMVELLGNAGATGCREAGRMG